MTIKLIILDCYGVAMEGGYPQTMKAIGEYFNRDWNDLHDIFYYKYFNMAAEKKITQKEAWVYAIKEVGLDLDWHEVRDLHYSFFKLNKEILPFVKEIKKKVKVLLLSKNTRSQFADAEKLTGFRKYYKNVINTWELGLPKANKKTYYYIMKKFRVKPEEIILIDDQENNLVEAKKLGIHTFFYQGLGKLKKEIKKIKEIKK